MSKRNGGARKAYRVKVWSDRLWSKVLLLGVVSILSVGCPTTTSYQPNDQIVQQMGAGQARQRLKDIILRSVSPQIVEAEVTDEYFSYRFRQAVAGFQTGAVLDNRVFFANAAQVNVHGNNLVNVLTGGQQVVAQLLFGNSEDARMFADLVTSFRLRRR